MNNDLYFIPIITEALQKTDPKKSLRKAFDRIQSLGERPQYRVGFKQFERFMTIVESGLDTGNDDLDDADAMSTLITELVTDIFEGGDTERQEVMSLIQSQPHLRKEYDQLVAEIGWLNQRPAGIGITIFYEDREFDSFSFTQVPGLKSIENIIPGYYRIALNTGRLLWEGDLTRQDLLWIKAFPGKALQLAADTGDLKGNPTRSISALNGEITIRIFAGIESGRIEIALNASGNFE